MRKKLLTALIILLVIGGFLAIYIPQYQIDQMFTYEIDKEKGEVTITGYLGDDNAREEYWRNERLGRENNVLVFPEKVEVPGKIKGYPVTAIGRRAFEWGKMKEVALPDTVVRLEYSAFAHCEDLEMLSGVENVKVLEDYALLDCKNLKQPDMPHLEEVSHASFAGLHKWETVIFPANIKVIPSWLCMDMDGLKTVNIPEGVEIIEGNAFGFCDSLQEIYIPPSVTEISRPNFAEIEDKVTILGEKGSYAEEYATEVGISFREVSK